MDCFRPLDLMLLSRGCSFDQASRCSRYSNILIKILITFFSISACTYFVASGVTKSSLGRVYNEADLVSGLLLIIVMTQKRSHLRDVLSHQVTNLSGDQRQDLRPVKCLVVFWILAVIQVPLMVQHLIVVKADALHIVIDTLFCYTRAADWFTMSAFVYCFAVKVIQATDENFCLKIRAETRNSFWSSPDPKTDLRLTVQRREMSREREELMSCFALIPCLWFLSLFLASSANIVDFFILGRYAKVAKLFSSAVILMYVINVCHSCTSAVEKRTTALITDMMSDNRYLMFPTLASELEQRSSPGFTAWHMFSIRRQIILPFVSALISFTVLFIQLAHSM